MLNAVNRFAEARAMFAVSRTLYCLSRMHVVLQNTMQSAVQFIINALGFLLIRWRQLHSIHPPYLIGTIVALTSVVFHSPITAYMCVSYQHINNYINNNARIAKYYF